MALLIGITHHAVDQYKKRHAQDLSFHEARAVLEAAVPTAVKLKEKTHTGQEQWHIEELGIVLVTKRDRGEYVCVTILPSFDPVRMTPEELERLEEYQLRIHEEAEALRKQLPDLQAKVVAPPPVKPAFFTKEQVRLVEASRVQIQELGKKIEVLNIERSIISAQAKTIRHVLTTESNVAKNKKALRAAIKFLMDHASQHPEAAAETMAEIRTAAPGLLTPEFWKRDP